MNYELENDLQAEVDAIQRIPIVNEMLEIICNTTGMSFAAVARVTPDRWVTCAAYDGIALGLQPGIELDVKTTFCNDIQQHHQIIAFDDADNDPRYGGHIAVKVYGIKSYISVPLILKSGEFFGTLCALDPNTTKVNNKETITMFRFYADLLSFNLDSDKRLRETEEMLKEEKSMAELREQFIAILGHDLRNPVSAINNVGQLLLRMPENERIKKLGRILQDTSRRMRDMIENILDFARGKLGQGIVLNLSDEPLEDHLYQVISELQISWPDVKIETTFKFRKTVLLDQQRISQLLSNLLSNALHHGTPGEPIEIYAETNEDGFKLSVCNQGTPIPAPVLPDLFKPFVRGSAKPEQKGLGLGLFIAAEIARAHHGNMSVTSDQSQTCFTLSIPLVPEQII